MFNEEYDLVAQTAKKKVDLLEKNFAGYMVSSILAGIYVGFGMLLIFTINGYMYGMQEVKVVMGLSFAVALSLVIMAGSDLFTGNNMIMTAGVLKKKITALQAVKLWTVCYIGNFIGSAILGLLFHGGGYVAGNLATAVSEGIIGKISHSSLELFMRGVLCNMLVCAAVWCSYKLKSESGKLIMIFWCIYAFITCGFEHSIANMTLFTIGFLNPADGITLSLMFHNLIFVSLGNLFGGALFSGIAYYLISRK